MRFHHLFVCVWLAVFVTTSATFSSYYRIRRPPAAIRGWPVRQYQFPIRNAVAPPALGGVWNGMPFRRQWPTQRPFYGLRDTMLGYDEHPDHHHIYHS